MPTKKNLNQMDMLNEKEEQATKETAVLADESDYVPRPKEYWEAFAELHYAEQESARLFDALQAVSVRLETLNQTGTAIPSDIEVLELRKAEFAELLERANEKVLQLMEKKRLAAHSIEDRIPSDDPVPRVQFEDVDIDIQEPSQLPRLVQTVNKIAAKNKKLPDLVDDEFKEALQLDLFVADLLDISFKDDMTTMEAPIYSLATRKGDTKVFHWESPDGKRWVTITPSIHGRATMHDKDVMIYLTSQLAAAMNRAERNGSKMPGRRVHFNLHDYLIATKKNSGGRSYTRIEEILDRLQSTSIRSSFLNSSKLETRGSSLIDSYTVIRDRKFPEDEGRMTAIEVVLPEWLYKAIGRKNILKINPSYFSLRMPLEKRLYEIARKHVGDQPEWIISEKNLASYCSSTSELKEFTRGLKTVIEKDNIPDYRLNRYNNESGEKMVRFYQKDSKRLAGAFLANETKNRTSSKKKN